MTSLFSRSGSASKPIKPIAALLLGTALCAPFALTSAPAGAQTKPATTPQNAAAIDPQAKATLEQMIAAYKALKSYSSAVKLNVAQGAKIRTLQGQIDFSLPNLARATTTEEAKKTTRTVVATGAARYVVSSLDTKSYIKEETPGDASSIAAVIGESGATLSGILPLMYSAPKPIDLLLRSAASLTKDADATLDGTPVDMVTLKLSSPGGEAGPTVSFATGKDDHLLRQIVMNMPGEGGTVGNTLTETYTAVKPNATPDASLWAFTPPPGAKEMARQEPQYFDPRLKVGANPLPFAGKDLTGAPVSLAAYRGKVLLLDFWATWCGPCRAEMPNVVAAYQKYHAKGFEVIGVSLDQEGARTKLVSFTKDNKMPWRQVYDGKYWESALAKNYGIQAIPFSLLIGKDGKIAAVNPRGEELEPALTKALAK